MSVCILDERCVLAYGVLFERGGSGMVTVGMVTAGMEIVGALNVVSRMPWSGHSHLTLSGNLHNFFLNPTS